VKINEVKSRMRKGETMGAKWRNVIVKALGDPVLKGGIKKT
jgi:hypothetical protein